MKNVVFDTNVTISAFFWSGLPRKAYEIARNKHIQLLYNTDIEKELTRVLSYKKFGLKPDEILPILLDFRKVAVWINGFSDLQIVNEDPTDNIFINCAVDGKYPFI